MTESCCILLSNVTCWSVLPHMTGWCHVRLTPLVCILTVFIMIHTYKYIYYTMTLALFCSHTRIYTNIYMFHISAGFSSLIGMYAHVCLYSTTKILLVDWRDTLIINKTQSYVTWLHPSAIQLWCMLTILRITNTLLFYWSDAFTLENSRIDTTYSLHETHFN